MKTTKLKPRSRLSWKPVFTPAGDRGTHGIYPARVFEQLIQYEKVRSDRLNAPVSLMAIRTASAGSAAGSAAAVEALRRRVRKTDAIGWLDAARIGVLLPSTGAAGARALAESLQPELPHKCGAIELSSHPHAVVGKTGGGGNGRISGVAHGLSFEQAFALPVPVWKRALDIIGAAAGLVLLSPVFAAVALYIKVMSPGPAFFTQLRVGRGGREFHFIKFRTMHPDNDEHIHSEHAVAFIRRNGEMKKLDESDPRIFFGGRLLRVLCIDELPQLVNVLRGEMSLVGPRPCIPYEAAEYQRWHRHRFSIIPGLTGLWQVSGKNKLSFAEMIRLDIKYEKTMSLGLDLLIILRTVPAITMLFLEAVQRRLARLGGELAEQRNNGR